jgi:hypothetical protein
MFNGLVRFTPENINPESCLRNNKKNRNLEKYYYEIRERNASCIEQIIHRREYVPYVRLVPQFYRSQYVRKDYAYENYYCLVAGHATVTITRGPILYYHVFFCRPYVQISTGFVERTSQSPYSIIC